MIIQFRVGNYRSFKAPVTFSMVAAPIKSKPESLDTNNTIFVDDDLTLLTSAAIYGANASGKSNVIKALDFMRSFVLNSSRETQINDAIRVEPFKLSTETDGKPSLFEIIFLQNEIQYRYGFEVTTEYIAAEWLYSTPKSRETKLFERKDGKIKINNRQFKEGRGLEQRTRNNALFLSVAAQFNSATATSILEWFKNVDINNGLNDTQGILYAMHFYEDTQYQKTMMQFVQQLDININDIQVERKNFNELVDRTSFISENFQHLYDALEKLTTNLERALAKTAHNKFNQAGVVISDEIFDLEEQESEGTKKLFALAFPVLYALRNGYIFVIDEFDARLHPLITSAIIRLFNSKETNPHGAQLIFATHDTNLLSSHLFRRDQIWFVEKSRQGFSDLYSLVEYRVRDGAMVRNDASFEKDYIEGRYGAIPFIGDLSSLIGAADEQETIAT